MESTPLSTLFRRVVALAFVLRLAYAVGTGEFGLTPKSHYREYVIAAERLLKYGVHASPLTTDANLAPSCLMPPAYAGLVALAYRTLGVETVDATRLLQLINIVASSLAAGFASLIAARLANARAGVMAGLLVAANPALIGFSTYLWDTSLFAFGATLATWWSVCLSRGCLTPARWVTFGLYLGALALLNPALTLAYPFLVLYPAIVQNGWRPGRLATAACWTVLGWGIAITPWTVRNYTHFNELHYVRCGFWLEVWLGVCPEAETRTVQVHHAHFPLLNEDLQRRVDSIGEAGFILNCRENARRAIRSDPWRLARLSVIRAMDYWAGTVFTHVPAGESGWPKSAARALVAAFYSVEAALALVGLLFFGRRRHWFVWLSGVVLAFSLIYILTHIQIRYRAPIEPLLAVLAGCTLAGVLWRFRQGVDRSDPVNRPVT